MAYDSVAHIATISFSSAALLGLALLLSRHRRTLRDLLFSMVGEDVSGSVHSAAENGGFDTSITQLYANLPVLLDSIPECVKIQDRTGRIIYMNSAGLRSLGMSCANQVVGRSVYDLVAHEYHPAYESLTEEVFRGRTGSLVIETGEPKPRRRWVRIKATPLRDQQGRVVSLLAISRDITERKRMQEKLEDYEIQLRTIIDSAPGGLVSHAADGRLLHVNPAAASILGIADELETHHFFRLLEPSSLVRYKELVSKLLEGRSGNIEVRTVPIDGAQKWVEIQAAPIRDRNGDTVAILGCLQDISERQLQQERVAEQQTELSYLHRINSMGEFACLLSHEINQPLCAISSYAEMGLELPEATDNSRDLFESIVRQANRASQTLKRIRGFVRKAPLQREVVQPEYLLSEAFELVKPMLRRSSIQWESELAEGLQDLYVDLVQIEQVLVNLIQNAIRSMNVKGGMRRLKISMATHMPTMIRVSIADTGTGIREELRARVLRPYYSGDGEGLGLGLSVSRTIVERHGGELWIDEPTRGWSTLVSFTLPIVDCDEAAASGSERASL